MLADMENTNSQSATIYGHANLHVTNKYLQATSKTKRHAQDRLVDAILAAGFCRKPNRAQIGGAYCEVGAGKSRAAFRPLISPDRWEQGL